MRVGPFPEVAEEPTSYVAHFAKNEIFPVYEKVKCPKCGGPAYRYHGEGRDETACRSCRTGKRILKRKVNYGDDWNRVREWVLERDNRTCQRCGAEDIELHIHHKKNLVWFETTKAAHTPNNLQALCVECHEYGP